GGRSPLAVLANPHPAAEYALGKVGGRGLEGVVVGGRLGAVGACGGAEGQGALGGAGAPGGAQLDGADETERPRVEPWLHAVPDPLPAVGVLAHRAGPVVAAVGGYRLDRVGARAPRGHAVGPAETA